MYTILTTWSNCVVIVFPGIKCNPSENTTCKTSKPVCRLLYTSENVIGCLITTGLLRDTGWTNREVGMIRDRY